ncbi:MAG TPA: NAD-dependent epimerase/dehydratase family protein [Nocardioides sp.]|uniref:NAD-dependent epimerase/dehydratase family protein n=1 Tax=Nocardioides sp. TaxID=35761 RepID=UPI002E338C86|nr:NAD-dependent epimerase/dehydratase family protein [Nocardioides sp.]HEX3931115.1 NAD-dependent epimerase/dehydratase family protein [Nocardioides sp.]
MTHDRVLVTGGAGFIGVNLAPVLASLGYLTRCYDDFSTGRRADAERAAYDEVVVGDILDLAALTEAARGCAHVVHLAAQAGVPASVRAPLEDSELNVRGTLNTLLAARDAKVGGFVFASSNAPLGEITPPAHEDMVPRPTSPYGASKLAGEAYCSAFTGSYGLPTTVLRFANVYGPFSYHKGSVVAAFCKQAMAGQPLVVYGDGTQTRDFVFVEDLCRGVGAALAHDGEATVAHLGSGVETTVLDVAQLVADRLGGASVEHQAERAGDVMRNYADISLARELLGFEPRVTLEEGLDRTVAWFRESSE